MIKSLLELTGNIIAVAAGLFAIKKLPTAYRLVFFAVSLALVNELLTAAINHAGKNGTWPNNIYLAADFGLYAAAGCLLINKKQLLYLLLPGAVIFAAAWIWNILTHGLNYFAIPAFITDSVLLIIVFTVLLYRDALTYRGKLGGSPAFWLCLSIIIFYGCDIPYFSALAAVGKLFPSQKEFLHQFEVGINNIHYLLITLAFLIFYRKQIQPAYEVNG